MTPIQPNLSTFKTKQLDLIKLTTKRSVENIMAAGGIRSGKSVTLTAAMKFRADRAPGSRHGIFHRYANTCYRNMFDTTTPETMRILYGDEWWEAFEADKAHYINKSDHIITWPNGSEFHYGGLDDMNKHRGTKFSTVWINEANYASYDDAQVLQGRLSETIAELRPGKILDTKFFIDLNPTVKSSWEYEVFVEGLIPGERSAIPDHADLYHWRLLNFADNKENLPANYFRRFEAMSESQRARDELGEWGEDNPNALFNLAKIGREPSPSIDSLSEIVVAIDPAGTANKNSDRTGIIVAGRDSAGGLHVLEDATCKEKPDVWIAKALELRETYDANWIITEKNYGQDILKSLMFRVAPNAPLKFVDAMGRGKRLRAEPVATMYERGRVSHAKPLRELEREMIEFDAPTFKGSPDRVDAMVYALTHLSGEKPAQPMRIKRLGGFMGA